MAEQQQQQYYCQSPVVYVPPGYMLVPLPDPDCAHPLLMWTTDVKHAGFKEERIKNVVQLLRSSPMDMSVADLFDCILSNGPNFAKARGKFMNSERHITSILNAISGDPNGRKILDAWLLNASGYCQESRRIYAPNSLFADSRHDHASADYSHVPPTRCAPIRLPSDRAPDPNTRVAHVQTGPTHDVTAQAGGGMFIVFEIRSHLIPYNLS